MKKLLTIGVLLLSMCMTMFAQEETKQLAMFKSYRPATINMTNGKVVRASFANIFLKNAALLYLRGDQTMEAYMNTIKSVRMDSLYFVNINNQLAQFIDSVGENRLYCVTLIDMDAYKTQLKNNVNISANSFSELVNGSDQISYSTVELEAEEDHRLPLIRVYYYLYNGKIIRVHEREISRRLPKSKRHIYKSVMALPDFSWVDAESLMKMLRAISEKDE